MRRGSRLELRGPGLQCWPGLQGKVREQGPRPVMRSLEAVAALGQGPDQCPVAAVTNDHRGLATTGICSLTALPQAGTHCVLAGHSLQGPWGGLPGPGPQVSTWFTARSSHPLTALPVSLNLRATRLARDDLLVSRTLS